MAAVGMFQRRQRIWTRTIILSQKDDASRLRPKSLRRHPAVGVLGQPIHLAMPSVLDEGGKIPGRTRTPASAEVNRTSAKPRSMALARMLSLIVIARCSHPRPR